MPLRLPLLLGLLLAGIARALAESPAPAAVWRIEGTEKIGGHETTVAGHPQSASGGGVAFDGKGDGLFIETNPLAGAAAFTVEVCFRSDPAGPAEQRFLHLEDTNRARLLFETRVRPDGRWALDTFLYAPAPGTRQVLFDPAKTHPGGRWTWVALAYADGRMRHYVDGVLELEGDVAFGPMTTGRTSLGVRQNRVSWFKGSIREIRFHHAALPPQDLQRAP